MRELQRKCRKSFGQTEEVRSQNSEQFMITRPRQMSLRQITLHFSCMTLAPQTGQTIRSDSETAGSGGGSLAKPASLELVARFFIGRADYDMRFVVTDLEHPIGPEFITFQQGIAARGAIHETHFAPVINPA